MRVATFVAIVFGFVAASFADEPVALDSDDSTSIADDFNLNDGVDVDVEVENTPASSAANSDDAFAASMSKFVHF